jgi:hypothetical protein
MSDSKKDLILEMHKDGHPSNRIACKLGLVKEFVDAVLQLQTQAIKTV